LSLREVGCGRATLPGQRLTSAQRDTREACRKRDRNGRHGDQTPSGRSEFRSLGTTRDRCIPLCGDDRAAAQTTHDIPCKAAFARDGANVDPVGNCREISTEFRALFIVGE